MQRLFKNPGLKTLLRKLKLTGNKISQSSVETNNVLLTKVGFKIKEPKANQTL